MKRYFLLAFFPLLSLSSIGHSQIPFATNVQIVRSEDARRYDKTLIGLMKDPNPAVRARAALAAGRIGDEKALDDLETLISDKSADVAAAAAFGIGEIESIKGADAILKILNEAKTPERVRARAIEAAGKIAAANQKDEKAKLLREAILKTLDDENRRDAKQDQTTVLLGLTAAARAGSTDTKRQRPDDTDFLTAEFLKNKDPRVRAVAANTLARLRTSVANSKLITILTADKDPIARANAARVLGGTQDRKAFDLLIRSAAEDVDSRVRISSIRGLAGFRDPRAADKLLERGEKLLVDYKRSKFTNPSEKNELIEISTALGRLLPDTGNERAAKLLDELVKLDDGHTAEISVARMGVKPSDFTISPNAFKTWWGLSTTAQVAGELANIFPRTEEVKKMRDAAPILLRRLGDNLATGYRVGARKNVIAAPDFLRAFAQFKTKDLDAFLRTSIAHEDVFVRTTAAELLGDRPPSKENIEALKHAWDRAAIADKEYNDARIAILDALFKLDKKEAAGVLLIALSSADYVTRRKALDMLSDKDLQKLSPGAPTLVERAYAKGTNRVFPYTAAYGTKLGQVLNTEADYRRAVSRKNGTVRALVATEKGEFTIELYPEDAPLTVDNIIKLAKVNYFNGLEVHRVVPNFVMQDGDVRGDGNGGPGWSIRCEINMRPYDRGAVGMALSGKDTGGSQWFITHSPQPHLDGGYTVFGHVDEIGMKVVDNIVRGDKIISVKIVGETAAPKPAKPTKTRVPVKGARIEQRSEVVKSLQ